MNILYQFNDRYAPFAAVSICSLLENNKAAEDIVIYALLEEVSEDSLKRLRAQVSAYGRSFIPIDAHDVIERLRELGLNDYRGSYATNLKLFLSDYIPEAVGRILYIDSDSLVVGEISGVMSMDMKGKPLGMALDSISVSHKKDIGFGNGEDYFNAGVILFDVRLWNEKECTKRIESFLSKESSMFVAPDQDILNIVFRNEIIRLDPEYNFQPFHIVYDYRTFDRYFHQDNYYGKTEIEKAGEDVKILHFFRYLGQFPWDEHSLHPDTELFDRYLALSEWSDYEKKPTDNHSFMFVAERALYRVLPKKLFLPIFRLFYGLRSRGAYRSSLRNINKGI